MSDKIEKLCELLDDTEQTSTKKEVAIPNAPSNNYDDKQRTNIKVSIFQLEQRMDYLENKFNNFQDTLLEEGKEEYNAEEIEKSKEEETKNKDEGQKVNEAKKTEGGTKDESVTGTEHKEENLANQKDGRKPRIEGGVKGLLTRHEFSINDINIRINEMENGMKELAPTSIRILIRNIAELVMREEKREVNEEMSNIKGSQEKHSQLVDLLKEELKTIDEKLQHDMEKKIERKDLADAKNQLRRRVFLFTNISCKI